jgi:hypothetical protein
MPGNFTQENLRGFSFVELAVAVAIVCIFCAVLLQRLQYLQEYAEMTAMQLTVANVRTGLRYKTGDLLIRDKVSEIPTLADENPVNWLENHPENYLGEFEAKPEMDLRGKWYFDKARHELVYTINNRRHFLPGSDQDYAFRWHAVRMPVRESSAPAGERPVQWVALVQVAGGTWF